MIAVITSNVGKANEIGAILGRPVEPVRLDHPEIQSLDVEVVARDKARRAYETLGRPVIVDDTGLGLAALHGLPGALVTWFLDRLTLAEFLSLAPPDERAATVTTAIGYADAHGVRVFVASLDGDLPSEPRGADGFGFDAILVPRGASLTLAEMGPSEKNEISPRASALRQLRLWLSTAPSGRRRPD